MIQDLRNINPQFTMEEIDAIVAASIDSLNPMIDPVNQVNSMINPINQKIDPVNKMVNPSEELVILNVGGVKYETYRSTLTAYPDTFLGTMFLERNQPLLKRGNEYFFDRCGKIFRYIMQYYRTGKVIIPNEDGITRKEFLIEMDYFQIPRAGSTIDRIVILRLNEIVNTFKYLIKEVSEYHMYKNSFKKFITEIDVCFLDNGQATVKAGIDNTLTDIFDSSKTYAYSIISVYKNEIKNYLEAEYPEITWEDEHRVGSVQYYKIKLCIKWELDHIKILNGSCLKIISD
ncbi:BTB/POZ protein [Glomus cerebriforme]|uniref:BTB/POZ protein n=1 Tax=Glomus cerebriforme TaxID=658196 RepID=A0A397SM26_9GLOM|nr:BTB/POZ protein [Glomus cerebriforme]